MKSGRWIGRLLVSGGRLERSVEAQRRAECCQQHRLEALAGETTTGWNTGSYW